MNTVVDRIVNGIAKIDKRQRFIASTLILTALMFVSSLLSFTIDRFFIIIIFFVLFLVSFIAIPTGINKIERVMLFLLPLWFTLAFNLFFFFLPGRWLTRVPFMTIYAISIYAILLSTNILNVGAAKTLQLSKAAFSINFLFLTVTSFLIFNIVLSFNFDFFLNCILFFLFIIPLSVQFTWSINPKTTLDREVIQYGAFIAFIIAQIGLFFSFVPIRPAIWALTTTACFYSLGGLFYAYLQERLFKERIREFISVLIFVLIVIILSVKWLG
jgi:hypothetical protein